MLTFQDLKRFDLSFIKKIIAIKQYKKYGYFKHKGWKVVLIKD